MGPRVLVVEDNRLLRWWMASSLEHSGFLVAAPETVDEALAVSDSSAVDILVTDWNLGESRDGFDVLSHARKTSPQLFAILISAEADGELELRAHQAGFDVVIQKPFPVAEITGAVHEYAQQFAKRSESSSGKPHARSEVA